MWQPVEKENTVKLCLKTDLMSHPARGVILINIHEQTHIYVCVGVGVLKKDSSNPPDSDNPQHALFFSKVIH